jgi:hypothetical protein
MRALASAGMITTELEPPRMAPSMTPWIHPHDAGRSPALAASTETGANTRMEATKPKRATSVPRKAALDSSCSRRVRPPSNSTTTRVMAPK